MENIKCFVECLLPVTACNLKCSYCYVIQENRRSLRIPSLDYDLDTIQKALSTERFGGVCYFSICGAGETLIPDYIVELVNRLLANGHYVNVTTNGTLSNRFSELVEAIPPQNIKRLHIAFSLHYLELKRLGLLQVFFSNIKRMQNAGASFVVQLNLCDEYIPYLDEIKDYCISQVGSLPQIAVTRREDGYPVKSVSIHTDLPIEDYVSYGNEFKSPLFDFTLNNFNKRRKEFCYAGAWSYQLNLKTGLLKRCYCSCVIQNIYKNVDKPIMHIPVGHACNSQYCFNSSHFMSLGVIPELETPTYAALRNREEAKWYNECMQEVLNHKLIESNTLCNWGVKKLSLIVGVYDLIAYKAYQFLINFKNNKRVP